MQYLYLIKCQQFYKIGITKNIKERIVQLQNTNPYQIDLVSLYQFPNMYSAYKCEQKFHKILYQYRVRGEWFELSEAAVDLVKKCFECIVSENQVLLMEYAEKLKITIGFVPEKLAGVK